MLGVTLHNCDFINNRNGKHHSTESEDQLLFSQPIDGLSLWATKKTDPLGSFPKKLFENQKWYMAGTFTTLFIKYPFEITSQNEIVLPI